MNWDISFSCLCTGTTPSALPGLQLADCKSWEPIGPYNCMSQFLIINLSTHTIGSVPLENTDEPGPFHLPSPRLSLPSFLTSCLSYVSSSTISFAAPVSIAAPVPLSPVVIRATVCGTLICSSPTTSLTQEECGVPECSHTARGRPRSQLRCRRPRSVSSCHRGRGSHPLPHISHSPTEPVTVQTPGSTCRGT